MKLTSTPCPCGQAGCCHVIVDQLGVRLRKDIADPIMDIVNIHDTLVKQSRALIKQLDLSNWVETDGHNAKNLKALADLRQTVEKIK